MLLPILFVILLIILTLDKGFNYQIYVYMKNLYLNKAILLAIFLLVSSLTFSNSVENSSSRARLESASLAGSIINFSPPSGPAGTPVTITGSGFTSVSTVSIGGGAAIAILPSSDSTTIYFIVPCNSNSGTISVDGGLASSDTFTYITPTVNPVANQSYCVGSTVPIFVPGGTPVTGLNYKWTSFPLITGLADELTGQPAMPTFTALNTTSEPLISTITLTPTINSCDGIPITYTFTINPLPVVSPIGDILNICSGTSVASIILTATSPTVIVGTGTSFAWKAVNPSDAIDIGMTTTSGSVSPIPGFTAINNTSAIISVDIIVTPTSEGCTGPDELYTISVLPASKGGDVTGGTTICSGSTSGILTLNNQVGTVVGWERAPSLTGPWTPLSASAGLTAYTSGVLTQTTFFRAIVQSSTCTPLASSIATVTVDPISVGGTATAAASTVCSGSSTLITLAGNTGSIQWQTNASGSFVDIPSANSTPYITPLLASTTSYRAIVTSGTCPSVISSVALISVDPTSVGGSVTGGTTVCSGNSSGTLTLAGEAGAVVRWESSITPFSTWTTIANTATSYSPGILTQTTQFRAVVQSGVCPLVNSTFTTVTVDPISVGGTATATTPVICIGGSTTITLMGHAGSIQWQTDASGSFATIPFETNPTYTTPALTNSTNYRAIVTSGTCTFATSSIATVTVNALPTVTVNSATICSGNTATITATPSPAGSYSYNWIVPSGAAPPGNVASFSTSIAGDYTVVITDTAVPNCSSLPATGKVTVNPLPNAIISGTNTVCLGTPAAITIIGSIGKSPYTFTYNVNGGATQTAVSAGTGNSITIPVSTTLVGVFNYNLLSVTDSSAPACSQPITSQTAILTVSAIPNLFITDPLDICQGGTTDLTLPAITTGSDVGLSYTYWTNITATIPYSSPAFATAGTYYIKGTAVSNVCPAIQPVKVTAIPLPTVTVNSQTICAGGSATITATPSPAGTYSYSWIVPAGVPNPGNVPSFTSNIAGNYTVQITNQSPPLCVSLSATGILTVNPLPTATITSSVSSVCIGNPATMTFTGSLGTAPYTFAYNINGGPTLSAVSTGNSLVMSVSTSFVGPITYNLLSVTDSSSTICTQAVTVSSTIIVRNLPTVNAGLDITVCSGESATLNGSGTATTYTWSNGVIDGVPFIPTITATYVVTGTDIFGCTTTDQVLVTVIPQIEATIKSPYDFKVCKNAVLPDITFVGSLGTAPYIFNYEITSPLLAVPITGTLTSTLLGEAILTPTIPTTTAGTFTVKLLGVQDSGFCKTGNIIDPKEAFITVLDAVISPINPVNVNQIVCENTPIVNIVFKINGSPTNAYVDGLPLNVLSTYDLSAGELTISGSPNEVGTFNYIVKTSGSLLGCNTQYSGTLTVNATGKLSAVSPSGSDLQNLCVNNAITTINYTIQGSATGATVVFTPKVPAGITVVISGTTVTLSGTPTETGIFNYTVSTFSSTNSCLQAQKTGTITVNESLIILASGTPNQTLCVNNTITPIDFDISNTPLTIPAASLVIVGTLPTGVTFNNITGIISGTPTQGGIFPYSIQSSTGCGAPLLGQITVNNTLPVVLIEGGLSKIDACKGSLITLTATGADTYTWYNLDVFGNLVPIANGNIYSYSPTKAETIFVIGKVIGGCENTAKIDVNLKEAITATITGVNTIDVCKDNSSPTITFTGSNGIAPYTFTYTINSLTNTVVTTVGNSAVISFPTNVTGIFDIKLTDVKDSSGSVYCNPSKLDEPTTAKVTVFDSSISPQVGAQIYQTVCIGTPIQDIKFNITGGAPNAYVLGLPLGISYLYGSGLLTISGTPTESGTFDYTVYTSGSSVACNTTFTATITVNADQTIKLLTTGKDNQQICPGASIDQFSYELGVSVTGVSVVFTPKTPSGITWNLTGNSLIFSGASNDTPANYNYTITTQGVCKSTTATGVITIIKTNSLVLTSGNKDETICVNTSLNTIQYNGNPGQTLVINGLLPPGVTFTADPVTGSATIVGTPTLIGNYLYSITTNNSCGDRIDGSIIVNANAYINYISGGLNQVACIGTAIEPLKYAVPLNITNTDVTIAPSLPPGLSYVVNGGELIISGTPTAISTITPYDITIISCGTPAKSTFNLTIVDFPVITLEPGSGSLSQSVCQNGLIIPIMFKLSGAATGIDLSILPTFITSTYNASTGIYTLTGAPKTAGIFTFNIKTIGNSSCSVSLPVTISNLYAALSISRTSAAGTDSQILCSFVNITSITYNIVGTIIPSDIKVFGLPTGVTSVNTATSTGVLVTISGRPTVAGVFNYSLLYQSCVDAIISGKISISSPISVTGTVTPITCGGNDGKVTVTLFGGTPFIDSNGNPYYSLSWSGPNGFSQNQTSISGLAAGVYTLTGVDAIGCQLPATSYTIAASLPINVSLISKTGMSCNGDLGCGNFKITGGTGIYTSFLLQYFDPSSQVLQTIIPPNNNYFNICGLKAGLYYLTATDSNTCKNVPYLFTIEDYSLLSIKSITLDDKLCSNTPGKIRIEVNSLDTNLKFFYNSVLISHTALGNNIYELSVSNPTTPNGVVTVNSQNCSVSTTVNTSILKPDFEFTSFEFEKNAYFSVNSSVEFKNLLDLNSIPQNSYISWDFGDKTPIKVFYYPKDLVANAVGDSFKSAFHSYRIDGFYEVTMTLFNSSGCSQSITKVITIGSGASMVLPTAFSPNNDGINDLFRPSLLGFKEVSMYIYDQWGNLVYEVSSDVLTLASDWGWNGIEKVNKEAVNGTYRFYIMAKATNNKIIEKEGRFLLIK